MENLTFYYSAMKGAKSMLIMQRAYNYKENGLNVLLVKSAIDTKGGSFLESRNGAKMEVDILLGKGEKLLSEKYANKVLETDYILIDEAQLLEPEQVEELWKISKVSNIGIICYGLRTNFKGELFPGSKRLFELADEIKELDTVSLCPCGNQAQFNARLLNGQYVTEGEVVIIDDKKHENIEYVPLCGECFLKKVLKKSY